MKVTVYVATILGFASAFLTTISFLPQTIKTIKEKNTEGISLLMYSVFSLGVFGWMVYGLMTRNFPVILANAVTLFFALIILVMKLRYR